MNGTAQGVDVSLGKRCIEIDEGAGLEPSEASSSAQSPSAGAVQE